MRHRLDYWGFETGEAGLRLGSHDLAGLAARFGTPHYLFHEDRLRENARRAQATACQRLPVAELLFSLKTNPHPAVLRILREEGYGAEAISARELRHAIAAGFTPDRMVFNGPGKSDRDLALAVQEDVLVHVESVSEARALVRAAEDSGRSVRAGIRIKPGVFEPRAQTALRMGAGDSVFGLDPAGDGFRDAVSILSASEAVDLVSLSAHIGTGIVSVEPYRRLARVLVEIVGDLADRGIQIHALDFGGGFAVASECRYEEGAFDELETHVPPEAPAPEDIASFEDICRAMSDEIDDTFSGRCILEPGRLLVSDAFHLITRVLRIKEEAGVRYAIVDAGRVQNALFVGRGYHELVHVDRPQASGEKPFTVVGPLCAGFDSFARSKLLPDLTEGDLLAVLDVGAYNLSAQSRWSFDPAPVLELGGGEVTLAKPRL